MRKLMMREAISEALFEEMKRDPKVFMMGEDIATGGAYAGVTEGLAEKIGIERVINTPISESCFTGAALGAALRGFRPIVEFMIADFIFVAADQVINQIAKVRYMSGGNVCAPITIRFPSGGYRTMASQHSQSIESFLIHTPGIKVVCASGAYSAKGLLKSAIRDDNPVAFLEPKILYEAVEEVPEGEFIIPLGKANTIKKGDELTVAAYGYQVSLAKKATESFPGLSVELIDLQSLNPLDLETIITSVSKTARLLIVQEDYQICSLAEHIAYEVNKNLSSKTRINIISSKYSPIPFSPPLEQYVLPQVKDIVEGIKTLIN